MYCVYSNSPSGSTPLPPAPSPPGADMAADRVALCLTSTRPAELQNDIYRLTSLMLLCLRWSSSEIVTAVTLSCSTVVQTGQEAEALLASLRRLRVAWPPPCSARTHCAGGGVLERRQRFALRAVDRPLAMFWQRFDEKQGPTSRTKTQDAILAVVTRSVAGSACSHGDGVPNGAQSIPSLRRSNWCTSDLPVPAFNTAGAQNIAGNVDAENQIVRASGCLGRIRHQAQPEMCSIRGRSGASMAASSAGSGQGAALLRPLPSLTSESSHGYEANSG